MKKMKMRDNWPLIGMLIVPLTLVVVALNRSSAEGPGQDDRSTSYGLGTAADLPGNSGKIEQGVTFDTKNPNGNTNDQLRPSFQATPSN